MLKEGKCPYLTQWWDMMTKKAMPKPEEMKCCLCTHMKLYNVWTCGAKTFRLKETTVKLPNGQWYFPSAEEIYNDYITSTGDQIQLPKPLSVVRALKEGGLRMFFVGRFSTKSSMKKS